VVFPVKICLRQFPGNYQMAKEESTWSVEATVGEIRRKIIKKYASL
jgi:hypothetical protein